MRGQVGQMGRAQHAVRVDRAGRVGQVGRFVACFMFLIVIADRAILYADDSVRLMVGRSAVVSTGTPIARVSLTSSDVADALVTSSTELLVNGKTPGTISMFVWDRAGAIKRYEIVVQRDLARLSEQLKQVFPNESIDVQSNGRNIALSGTVSSKEIIERAINLSAGYVDKKDDVVSLLQLREGAPTNQVLLRVRFAEVSRSALTELGVNLFTSPSGYKDFVGRTTTQQFAAPGFADRIGPPPPSAPDAEGKFTFSDFMNVFLFNTKYQVGTVIRALQTRGLFQSLAEPNLVAESGKEASFLAGGEFPVPIAQPSAGTTTVTVTFKEFGIRLTFTPQVNGNRVHLKVKPEVSTLDYGNAVTLGGFRIPALNTRRTETELELMDGQTFAIAGLMNNTMTKSLQKIPGIGDIPVLGLLFKSQAAQKDRTELVVMITPHILANNSVGVTGEVPRAQEPFLPGSDPKTTLPMPPPAFTPGASSAPAPKRGTPSQDIQPMAAPAQAAQPATIQPAVQPVAPRPADPMAAAATVQGLNPSAATPRMQAPAPAAAPAASASPAAAAPTGAAPSATTATATNKPTTEAEKKALEKAKKDEHDRAEAAKAVDGRARAKQLESDRKTADEDKKAQDEQKKAQEKSDKAAAAAAKRQAEIDRNANEAAAKRAAEQAKKQAEIDKKQAEADKQNQKSVTDAEAKLKAAQAAYEAEVAKTKKPQGQ